MVEQVPIRTESNQHKGASRDQKDEVRSCALIGDAVAAWAYPSHGWVCPSKEAAPYIRFIGQLRNECWKRDFPHRVELAATREVIL